MIYVEQFKLSFLAAFAVLCQQLCFKSPSTYALVPTFASVLGTVLYRKINQILQLMHLFFF